MHVDLQELITATKTHIGLNDFTIEKDFYITKALQILSAIEDEHFHLIFAGGTCLAKGYRLIDRMSEDVDFKFQKKATCAGLSKNQYLKALKKLRNNIVETLEKTNFSLGEIVARNEGQYLRIELKYTSAFPVGVLLRPYLLLEFTASEIRLATQKLTITTLIQDTLGDVFNFEPCILSCISVEETAAEKWVGLTRRIAAIARGYFPDDETLIRHVYDLSSIVTANKLGKAFPELASDIITIDAKQFKSQHPEYFANPVQEIKKSLKVLKNEPIWEKRYKNFFDIMVYHKTAANNYQTALQKVGKISRLVFMRE